MPIPARRSPFGPRATPDLSLRTPQARVLAALMPEQPDDPPILWPILTRAHLGVAAGYTAISGSITRALNGIREGSSSGDAHPGLLARGMVEEVVLDIEGREEVCYRATALGVQAYRAYERQHGALPVVRDREACINDRYKKSGENSENA